MKKKVSNKKRVAEKPAAVVPAVVTPQIENRLTLLENRVAELEKFLPRPEVEAQDAAS